MSSKNIVNKDYYDIAGRDRVDERGQGDAEKPQPTKTRAATTGRGAQNFIPGAAPVGDANRHASNKADTDAESDAGEGIEQADEAGRSSSID